MADQSSTSNEKYVVFKREDFEAFLAEPVQGVSADAVRAVTELRAKELDDAVVIRRQDIFAPPALDTYANSILVALSLQAFNQDEEHQNRIARLQNVADYFHTQAELSWNTHRKLPD